METQEFDEELQETNRIYKEIGDLNTKELLELQGAITQIKENSQKEKKENTLSWLEQSVISVLKDYAEENGATFKSEDDEVGNRRYEALHPRRERCSVSRTVSQQRRLRLRRASESRPQGIRGHLSICGCS